MELHRADKKPDWESVQPESRNDWQKMAAQTRGFVTPGNIITVIGLLTVTAGLFAVIADQFWLGASLLVLGRALDIADGVVANKTGTKGPLGELMDAGADKIGTFLTVLVFAYIEIIDYWLLVAVVLPQVIIAVIVSITTAQRRRFHPSHIGKLSMAVAWFALVGFVVVRALDTNGALETVVSIIAVVSGVMALYATIGYVKDAWFRSAAS